MAAEDKYQKASPVKKRGAFFIFFTLAIVAGFTGLIAFGVQTIIGGNEKPAEGTLVNGVRTFNITVKEWEYDPPVLKVNPGETVRFIITSKDVWHGFAVNELNLNLTIPSEKTVGKDVVIPADAANKVYTSYCSVFCGLGHPYLKGKIIVGNPKLFLGIGVGKTLPYAATVVLAGIFTAVLVVGYRKARRTP